MTEVDSVSEALLLEANLIKRFKPRFNVRLKDDKSYPYIKVTLGDDFPRIERTRKLPNDGSRYFGPYASASSVDEAMNLVRRLFPFRTCTIDIREGERALPRPCLLYHIKRCQGPCIEAISQGRLPRATSPRWSCSSRATPDTLLEGLRHEMHVASEGEQYEKAAVVRDKIRSIERTMESQKMAAFARTELDLVGAGPQGRPGGGAAVRRAQRQDAGPGRVLPRGPPRRARRRGARPVPAPVLRPGDERAARGPRAALRDRHGGARGVPGRPAGERRPPARPPSAARSAS